MKTESGKEVMRSKSRDVIGRIYWMAANIALGSSLLLGALLPALAEVKIGIIGDQTGAADIDKAYRVLQQGVDVMKRERPDVVLHTGDLVESLQTPEQIKTRFDQATAILGQLSAPWYLTAGDHDVSPPRFEQNSPDRSRELLFRTLYGRLNARV